MSRLRRPTSPCSPPCSPAAAWPPAASTPTRTRPSCSAENEGLYLDLGELKYQVQISRQLNPDDIQDRSTCIGVPAAERRAEPDEVWFGVFLQVENEADEPLQPSGDIEIVDTQEDVFKPLALDDDERLRLPLDRADPRRARSLPLPDTPAYDTPIQGSLLLFKLTLDGARQPPARAEDRGHADARSRRASSTSTSVGPPATAGYRVAFSAATSTCSATGAAVSPPAPASTSSTPTATRGSSAGA